LPPYLAAAREAYEAAGLYGCVAEEPIGGYMRTERSRRGRILTCEVEVFLLAVEGQIEGRPTREQLWLAPETAALVVAEPTLGDLLRDAERLRLFTPGL
jgi:hypothetical protein